MFKVYSRYPFSVPARTKFFNAFRYPFSISILERFLVSQLINSKINWWLKFIPPVYFYAKGSIRLVERHDIKYKVDISNLLSHSIYFDTVRDRGWNNLFTLVRPEFHVLDIGANIGYLTLAFARRCTKGFVYSFEPDSESFEFLKENIKLNNYSNTKIFNIALGLNEGNAQLFKLYKNNTGANRIVTQNFPKQVESETVAICTLDSYIREFERVNLIKVDVEGFELFVLKGGVHVIKKWKPILFVELVDINLNQQGCTGHDLLKFIDSLDYTCVDAISMKLVDRSQTKFYADIICYPIQ